MQKRIDKRGQMELSFGMIVSILMIIAFISLAVFVIYKFVVFSDETQCNLFVQDLRDGVDALWRSAAGGRQVLDLGRLSGKVDKICFVDLNEPANNLRDIYEDVSVYAEDTNFLFYPLGSCGSITTRFIEHVNISQTTRQKNPLCIENEGKITLTIDKKFDEALVTVGE